VSESIPPEARVGTVVDGRFQLVKYLASGAMAAVYRAEHLQNGQVFAVKVLDKEFSDKPEVAARFQREVQAYRRIHHPNVVAAIDFGRLDDGCLFMVLEFIQGHDLGELLARTLHLSSPRAAKIALQISLALVAAHGIGVVHRDLKPDNVMLVTRGTDEEYVKLVDFGIAKVPSSGQPLTALGSVFGTPGYMAPEQARGGAVDARTDLYALGIVLYEMLSGAPPFVGDSVGDILVAHVTKPPPPLPASVDPELSALVQQLLAKDPAHRVQTATELSQRLRAILERVAPELLVEQPAGRPPSVPPAARQSSRPPPAAPEISVGETLMTVPLLLDRPLSVPPAPAPIPEKKSAGFLATVVAFGIVVALGWFVARMLFG